MIWLVFGVACFMVLIILGAALGAWADGLAGFFGGAIIGGFFGFMAFLGFACIGYNFYNERTISCQTLEKDRGGNEGGMRVYTSCGVFYNADSWMRGKTRSADLWPKIHPGETQTFRVVGWRLGITSDMPNILEVK